MNDRKYLFAFTWEDLEFTWTVMPQGYIKNLTYFSQILTDLNDVEFPRNSTLIQYLDDLLLCSRTSIRLLRGHNYLLKQLVIKGHGVSKDKL